MAPEEPRILHLDQKATRRRLLFHTGWDLSMRASRPTPTVTHFLQQGLQIVPFPGPSTFKPSRPFRVRHIKPMILDFIDYYTAVTNSKIWVSF